MCLLGLDLNQGHLEMSGDIFSCHEQGNRGGGGYLPLVGRSQGCC